MPKLSEVIFQNCPTVFTIALGRWAVGISQEDAEGGTVVGSRPLSYRYVMGGPPELHRSLVA